MFGVNTIFCLYRSGFWCKRKFWDASSQVVGADAERQPLNVPWLWVGGYLDDGITSITLTNEINNELFEYNGNTICVDKEFLSIATGYNSINKWVYIDSETLEEVEFPPEGITIKR